jgi:positive regulator of sigma E activity
MDYTGTVENIEDDRALVKTDINGEEKLISASNKKGADKGAKVEVQIPNVMSEGISAMVYMIPLAGVIAGAVGGRFLGGVQAFKDLAGKIAGPIIGGVFSSSDNLSMALGFLGLLISVVLLSVWINKRKQKLEKMAEIVRIIGD